MNLESHYNSTASEIWDQTDGKVDAFVSGSGTGGTIAGVSRFLKEKDQSTMIALVDPPGSSLHHRVNSGVLFTIEEKEMYRLANPYDTIIEGAGINRLTENFQEAIIDKSFRCSDQEAVDMAHFLIYNEGLLLGSTSGMNLVGCVKLAREMKPGS
jgi:cysteine synthase A